MDKLIYFTKTEIVKEYNGYDYDLSYYIGGLRIGKKYFNKIILKEVEKYISLDLYPIKTKLNSINDWSLTSKLIKVICDDNYDFEVDYDKFIEKIKLLK